MVGELAAVGLVVVLLLGLVLGPIAGLLVAVAVAALVGYVWRSGEAVVRRTIGGRPADPERDARLVNLVDGIAAASGVPPPGLLVLDDPAPNALTFGFDARNATIAVTTGLLERLSRVELEGVVAREVARIKTQEIQPATVAAGVLRVVGPIAPWARHVRAVATGDASLVLADAQGVRITRYPPGLANALERLGADAAGVRASSPVIAHLWVEPPASSTAVHPPLEERIEALREL